MAIGRKLKLVKNPNWAEIRITIKIEIELKNEVPNWIENQKYKCPNQTDQNPNCNFKLDQNRNELKIGSS